LWFTVLKEGFCGLVGNDEAMTLMPQRMDPHEEHVPSVVQLSERPSGNGFENANGLSNGFRLPLVGKEQLLHDAPENYVDIMASETKPQYPKSSTLRNRNFRIRTLPTIAENGQPLEPSGLEILATQEVLGVTDDGDLSETASGNAIGGAVPRAKTHGKYPSISTPWVRIKVLPPWARRLTAPVHAGK
jgi:hypothetical protein